MLSARSGRRTTPARAERVETGEDHCKERPKCCNPSIGVVFKRMRPEMVVRMSARTVRARCDGRTFDMKLFTCVAALVTALLMTHSASAAAPLGKACAAEIKAQCADVKPGGGRIRDCLKAHSSDLSEGCQEAINSAAYTVNSAAAVGKTCAAEIKAQCADVKPGGGRIRDCLKAHAADVSDGCKEAMAKAEAGNK